jgi:hypothetical protein
MQKWEYKRVSFAGVGSRMSVTHIDGQIPEKQESELDSYLAHLGDQGWELAATAGQYGSTLIFKRPKRLAER